jgi:hypothetical protein
MRVMLNTMNPDSTFWCLNPHGAETARRQEMSCQVCKAGDGG